MVKKPLSLNHYAFLNQLLELKGNKRLEPKKAISDKDEIIEKLKAKQSEFKELLKKANQDAELQANLTKIQRALETLVNDEKRAQYDDAITNAPNIELKHKDKGTMIVPLVPTSKIIEEFNSFRSEMVGQKNSEGKPYTEGDFQYEKHEGPPTMHVFSFPDKASADAFLKRLFGKDMAMYPNGSQELEPPKQPVQKSIKDTLQSMRALNTSKVDNEEHELDEGHTAAPTPFHKAPSN